MNHRWGFAGRLEDGERGRRSDSSNTPNIGSVQFRVQGIPRYALKHGPWGTYADGSRTGSGHVQQKIAVGRVACPRNQHLHVHHDIRAIRVRCLYRVSSSSPTEPWMMMMMCCCWVCRKTDRFGSEDARVVWLWAHRPATEDHVKNSAASTIDTAVCSYGGGG